MIDYNEYEETEYTENRNEVEEVIEINEIEWDSKLDKCKAKLQSRSSKIKKLEARDKRLTGIYIGLICLMEIVLFGIAGLGFAGVI